MDFQLLHDGFNNILWNQSSVLVQNTPAGSYKKELSLFLSAVKWNPGNIKEQRIEPLVWNTLGKGDWIPQLGEKPRNCRTEVNCHFPSSRTLCASLGTHIPEFCILGEQRVGQTGMWGSKEPGQGQIKLISKLCSKGSRKQSCFSSRIKVLRQESPFGKRGICPGDLPEKY